MRYLHRTVAVLLSTLLLLINFSVHRAPLVGSDQERSGIIAQLTYLKKEAHTGLGERMQAMFPEGSVFTHALYGSAWCGSARSAGDTTLRAQAAAEAEWAYAQLDAPAAKSAFPTVVQPKYGAFYAGWRNYLLACIIELEGERAAARLVSEFDAQSAELAFAYSGSPSPYIPSYDGMAWPADNVVAMASLALHQRLRHVDHGEVIGHWLRRIEQRLDTNGCVPHAWDPVIDRIAEGARGSSQSLINCFLPMIDSTFAKEQFALYHHRFLDTRLGLPMVREFAIGCDGRGDVDSGPVIFGAGPSATIVGPGACRMNADPEAAHALDATIEGSGLPFGGDRKRFVFGLMPIADLFIVWTRTRSLPMTVSSAEPSFMAFHFWSLAIVAILWSPWIVQRWRRERPALI